MKKLNILESDIRKQVKDYLQKTGWLVLYFLQGLGSYSGLSDLCAIKNGRVLWIEIKRPGKGKQSEKQVEFQQQIESHGGTYIIATGVEDLEKI